MLDRVVAGEVPKKPHTALRGPEGELRYEECLTRAGFDGPYSILYHCKRPQTLRAVGTSSAGWKLSEPSGDPNLRRRHFRSNALPSDGGAPLDARIPLLENDDVVVSVARPHTSDTVYWSNGDADDLFFVHRGSGLVRTPFGDLRFGEGDYVCIPRGVLRRFMLEDGGAHFLVIECHRGVGIPKQFRNDIGQLRMDAPYGHRDFIRPAFSGPRDEAISRVVVKRNGAFHEYAAEHSPLDVVGWDGTVYPWAFPIERFQPRVGAIHLPPTVHGTFAAGGALVCSFVPRLLDFHPDAIPCPYPHSSVDVDEVIFYVRGGFTSRKKIESGSVTLHPSGIAHGPHPGAYEESLGATHTEELAVMLDCHRPLRPTAASRRIEDATYDASFG